MLVRVAPIQDRLARQGELKIIRNDGEQYVPVESARIVDPWYEDGPILAEYVANPGGHDVRENDRLIRLSVRNQNRHRESRLLVYSPNHPGEPRDIAFWNGWVDVPSPGDNEYRLEDSCFVATAVYGPGAPEVDVLRRMRDTHPLLQSGLGKRAVDFYYSGAGERTAAFIQEHAPFLIRPIRKGLDYIVSAHKKA